MDESVNVSPPSTAKRVNFLEEPEVIVRVSPIPSSEDLLESMSNLDSTSESDIDDQLLNNLLSGETIIISDSSDSDANTNNIIEIRPPPTPIPNHLLHHHQNETEEFSTTPPPSRGRNPDRKLPYTDPVLSKTAHHYHRDLSVSGLKLLKERAEKKNQKKRGYMKKRESFQDVTLNQSDSEDVDENDEKKSSRNETDLSEQAEVPSSSRINKKKSWTIKNGFNSAEEETGSGMKSPWSGRQALSLDEELNPNPSGASILPLEASSIDEDNQHLDTSASLTHSTSSTISTTTTTKDKNVKEKNDLVKQRAKPKPIDSKSKSTIKPTTSKSQTQNQKK